MLIGTDESPRQQLEFKLKKSLYDWQSAELAAANRLWNNQKRNIDLILESGWHQQKIIGEILDRADPERAVLTSGLLSRAARGTVRRAEVRSVLAAALLTALAGPTAAGNSCTVTATSLAFGSYQPGAGAATSAATVTITCNAGAFFAVGASPGNSGTEAQRLMYNGTHTLQYNLYTSASLATIWGDGSGTTGVFSAIATGSSSPSVFNYYGLLPDNTLNQGAVAGSYSDTIIVVVSF